MVDTVDVHYIYPANWEDAPNKPNDQRQGWRSIVVQFTSLSDGTGETDVTKVDISELVGPTGQPVRKTAVEWIQYDCTGMGVTLEWDHAPNALIARLDQSQGDIDWTYSGGKVDPSDTTDRTGDILLTTNSADSGDAYNITMKIRLKE